MGLLTTVDRPTDTDIFAINELVWVRSYSTFRGALGKIIVFAPGTDGKMMAAVEMKTPYLNWDDPELPSVDVIDKVIAIELWRLEKLQW